MRLFPRLEGKQKYCAITAKLIQFPFQGVQALHAKKSYTVIKALSPRIYSD